MEQLCDGDQEQESLDEMADAGEEIAGATVFDSSLDCDGVDDSADIEPFLVPPQHRSALECPIMQAKELKKAGLSRVKIPLCVSFQKSSFDQNGQRASIGAVRSTWVTRKAVTRRS